MKKAIVGFAAGVLTASLMTGSALAEPKQKWTLTGFSHPESVDLDIPHQVFYVSNLNGGPLDKDGNGFISKVSRDGKMIQLKWIEGGMNAPKGIVQQGHKMWVSDIDRLHEIDTNTGKIVNSYDAPGAVFLNDTAVDAKGNVYVSDIAKGTIWRMSGGKMELWVGEDAKLPHINGMRVIYGGKLLVAGWGSKPMHDDGSTDVNGHLFTVDLASKEVKDLGDGRPVGNLDGLERDAHGNFLATDFVKGGLIRIHKNGSFEKLLDMEPSTADLDTIDKGRTAVIPIMMKDTITAYSVD